MMKAPAPQFAPPFDHPLRAIAPFPLGVEESLPRSSLR